MAGVRRVYDAVLDTARAHRKPDQALLATGHCHMVDATASELSERTILGGLAHALPADLFPPDVGYVALGHLHLAQQIGDRSHIRYSGSPIPLAMPEESYPHQLRMIRFEGVRLVAQEAVPIPRTVDILRVPKEGPGELEEVLAELSRLEVPEGLAAEQQPFLEVRVRLSAPVPDLREQIEKAIGERAVRLVKIGVERVGGKEALAESAPRRELAELDVEDVFRSAYARRFEGEPSHALLDAFREVADAARQGLEDP